jgi:DNA mismatch endonuclease (patch repair protein)
MKMTTALAKKTGDIFTKAKRSQVMSRIRSRGNKDTEIALAKLFRRNKITGWRKQIEVRIQKSGVRIFKVRPDFIFPKLKLAIFADGCFWHGCPKHGTQPKGNRTFWKNKFARNKARDVLVTRTLRSAKWRVLRVWEHTLRWATRKPENEARLVRRIKNSFHVDGSLRSRASKPACSK